MTSGKQTYRSEHFEMYRNIKSLCCVTGTNRVVGQFYFKNKQTHRKRDQICGYQKAELDEGSQKVQTSNYRINNYQGCNVQHDKYN